MNDILNKAIVLVLNRNWQAINTTTPALAFGQMATDVATGLDIRGRDWMVPVKWSDWLDLPVGYMVLRMVQSMPTATVFVRFRRFEEES